MRFSFLLLCISFCLTAQIQDLAPTDDGTVLYFSTPYRLKGSSDVGYSKIFHCTDNEFQLFREIALIPNYYGSDSNFYLAAHPSVSGDGRTIVYTASRNCVDRVPAHADEKGGHGQNGGGRGQAGARRS